MDLSNFLTPQGFAGLVAQLLSAENEDRKTAEAVFEQVKLQQPEACAGNLLAILRSAPDLEHRSFAAIMMRKVGTSRYARQDAGVLDALYSLETMHACYRRPGRTRAHIPHQPP